VTSTSNVSVSGSCSASYYLFLFLFLKMFPYIPFRYIPWKWKMPHAVYLFRQVTNNIISISDVGRCAIQPFSTD
jgi:hypothetical protein